MSKKIGLVLVFSITLLIAYNLIVQIFDALKSSERLSLEAEKLSRLEVKNRELKEQLARVKSLEFIEEQARDKLGLARTGETIVIIPEDKLQEVLGLSKKVGEVRLPNWLGWWRLFFP